VPWKNRLRIWLPRLAVLSLIIAFGLNYFYTHYICLNSEGIQRGCGPGDALAKLGSALNASTKSPLFIAIILLGASILGSAAAFLGIPRAIADFVASLGLSPFMLIVALIVFYLILGCFLDGFSMIVMTLPIVLPIVKGAGFNEVWFGIFLVLVVEMAQITPPVGFNLFVIQGLTGDGLGYIARVTLPYLVIMILFTIFITVFPGIPLWLPAVLAGH